MKTIEVHLIGQDDNPISKFTSEVIPRVGETIELKASEDLSLIVVGVNHIVQIMIVNRKPAHQSNKVIQLFVQKIKS